MKLAVISPVSMLKECSTDYHLVLTQYCDVIPYGVFYRRRRIAGDFVVLDNGAAEIKDSVGIDHLIRTALYIQPSLVVAPDTIYDSQQTMQRTVGFVEAYAEQLKYLGIGVMAVPQGATVEEWEACYRVFNADSRVDWLGISKFYTSKFHKRLNVLKRIASTVSKPCHLLGVWDNPYDLQEEKQFPFVKGVDTAKPVEFAMEGLTLAEWKKHKHVDDTWYVNASYGNVYDLCRTKSEASALSYEMTVRRLIDANIAEMKEICK